MRNLRREVEAVFPNASSFVRPGFDEPWRFTSKRKEWDFVRSVPRREIFEISWSLVMTTKSFEESIARSR